MKVSVRLQRQYNTIHMPKYQTKGAAGFDLASAEAYSIPSGEHRLINTGLVIETPPGHVLMLAPRSSLYAKKGLILTNSVGIIDEDYCGPNDHILLSLKNESDDTTYIDINERIAQGIFLPVMRAEFYEESQSQAGIRPNRSGFGSSGGYKKVEVWEGGRKIGEQG